MSDQPALVFYTGVICPPSLLFTRQLDRQIAQLSGIDLGWRLRHQIEAAIVFRERYHVADALLASDEHD